MYIKSGDGFLLVFSLTSLESVSELYHLREQIQRIKDASNTSGIVSAFSLSLVYPRADTRNEREPDPRLCVASPASKSSDRPRRFETRLDQRTTGQTRSRGPTESVVGGRAVLRDEFKKRDQRTCAIVSLSASALPQARTKCMIAHTKMILRPHE